MSTWTKVENTKLNGLRLKRPQTQSFQYQSHHFDQTKSKNSPIIHKNNTPMESLIKNFLINTLIITASLTYSYYIPSKLPKDIVTAVINAIIRPLTGYELEPSSNHPYLATSLQNFWARWNLMVTNTLRHTVYKPVTLAFNKYAWGPLVGVMVSFLVSGLMHELFVYVLAREAPTWEMTWFFVIHGVCVVVEMIVKRVVVDGSSWRLPEVVGRVGTVAFVAVTGVWLFMPPLVKRRLDVKILEEYMLVVEFIKDKVFGH
ncbi:MBOAT (membrane bound O-acyl transferase) family protein [Artemisia annua]|uniref:MBOAT (Membrane bound O-acyl transferase) family protein n=1 Tax=Artemisia annua TaxID=35608 RepID=A0A2U1LYX6_ARTAN|nr:MBOAT (membrane bound O-acyl transferase) family protein [Artemisia annua]